MDINHQDLITCVCVKHIKIPSLRTKKCLCTEKEFTDIAPATTKMFKQNLCVIRSDHKVLGNINKKTEEFKSLYNDSFKERTEIVVVVNKMEFWFWFYQIFLCKTKQKV